MHQLQQLQQQTTTTTTTETQVAEQAQQCASGIGTAHYIWTSEMPRDKIYHSRFVAFDRSFPVILESRENKRMS